MPDSQAENRRYWTLFAPHDDDETLFCAYTLLQHRPHVVVVFDEGRRTETAAALAELGYTDSDTYTGGDLPDALWTGWHFDIHNPDWTNVSDAIRNVSFSDERVWAPAVEPGGHEQHNRVGELALEHFGPERVTQYLTYTQDGRSREGIEVEPEEWSWVTRKMRALSHYESQIAHSARRSWFYPQPDLREWIVA